MEEEVVGDCEGELKWERLKWGTDEDFLKRKFFLTGTQMLCMGEAMSS